MTLPDDDPIDGDAIARAWRGIQDRDGRQYDGVNGLPPEWMPEPLQAEFYEVRATLLTYYSAGQVLHWIAALRGFVRNQEAELAAVSAVAAHAEGPLTMLAQLAPSRVEFPIELVHDLRALSYIHHIASLGEARGYAAYLGTGPDAIYRESLRESLFRDRQRQLAARRRHDALQKLIIALLTADRSLTNRGVLNALRTHGVPIQEVDDDDTIYWIDNSGKEQVTTTASLPNRVTKARQELGISEPRRTRNS